MWVAGLAVAAAYMMNKNMTEVKSQLDSAENKYNSAAKPATGGVTSKEIRKSWANTDFVKYGDMSEDLTKAQRNALDEKVQAQQALVEKFEVENVPQIQGVMLTFDRGGF